MSHHGEVFDVTIIGAGPVGLYAAIYAGSRNRRVKVIESLSHPGGRLITHYPDKTIHDVAGTPEVRASELTDRLIEQCESFGVELFYNQRVEKLTRNDAGIWSLHTPAGEHRSRTVVIAAGVGAFIPEKLDMEEADRLEGKGVFYDLQRLDKFRDKRVVVIATGDEAINWAFKLREVTDDVTIVHRLNRIAAPEEVQKALDDKGIHLRYPFQEIKSLHGSEMLEGVTVINTATGVEERFDCDALVLNIGFLVNLNTFKDWGLVISSNAINVNERMETNLPGVFAVGDIVTHPGKLKLISTGAGEAAIAVSNALEFAAESDRTSRRKKAGTERVLSEGSSFYSGSEAVQMSIYLEQRALEFYKAAFYRAGNDATKGLFARMQRNKLDNIEMLKGQVLPKFSGGAWQLEDLDDTAASYLASQSAQYLTTGIDLANEALKNIGSELQNIYTGIQVEEDLKAFHSRVSQEEQLARVREHFQRLIETKDQELSLLRSRQADLMEAGISK